MIQNGSVCICVYGCRYVQEGETVFNENGAIDS